MIKKVITIPYRVLKGDWNPEGFKKYFYNMGWMFIARMVAYAVSFATIAIVARYLGPENFGKLSYAQVYVSIFSVFATLGIDQILQRDLVAHLEKKRELLGTAFGTRLAFGLLTFIATVISAFVLNEDPILTWMIGIIALSFIVQPSNVVAQVFAAEAKSKYLAYATIVVAFIIPLAKLVLVFLGQGILYFAAILTLETIIYGVAYFAFYNYLLKRSPTEWTFSYTQSVKLLRDSWPLMLASFSGYIYGRIDQVMILHYLDSTSVGLYDIAVRITEMLGFVPGVIIGSLFPAVVNARRHSQAEYTKRWRALIILTAFITIISALIIYLIAPIFITAVFGNEFIGAISLLQIYVWSIIGTMGIILMQQFFIVEHRSQLFLVFSILGALCNVLLNMLFIPKFGTHGAAYATLITVTFVVITFVIIRPYLGVTKSHV
jgi:O-antigen/teichoic acid export membrane protein